MAQLPVEVIPANAKISMLLKRVLDIANSIQSELRFALCDEQDLLDALAFAPKDELSTVSFFDSLELARANSRGYHPFIIGFTDAFLTGSTLSNLFADSRAAKGAALVTYYQVGKIVGTEDDALTGYALYYLARYSMGFISPSVKNHDESRQCIYDRKLNKMDIIDSFRSGALCDKCRLAIWQSRKGTMAQMDSVDKLIEHASSLVHKTKIKRRPNIFIGSSSRNISYARNLKHLLGDEFLAQVWDEDQVFRLGTATIEQLEEHVKYYDFGIFVMLPDDKLIRDDVESMVPRDNVVFEAGLFTGKLSRTRAIIVTARNNQVLLPSDLNGLTTLQVEFPAPLPDSLIEAARKAAGHIRYVFGEGR
jgi:predicted nucleotide-binding protein